MIASSAFFTENKAALSILVILTSLVLLWFFLLRERPVEVPVTPVALRADLTLGGQSSAAFPEPVVLESLKANQRRGYELLALAFRENIIREFREAEPGYDWDTRFITDNGPKELVFRKQAMRIRAFKVDEVQSNELFQLGLELYDFEATGGLESLDSRMTELLDLLDATALYEGDSLPEIASAASALAEDLQLWIAESGDLIVPERRRYLEAQAALAAAATALATSVDQTNLDAYNSAVDAYNQASDELGAVG